MNELELAELDFAVANAEQVWEIAHQWHWAMTLDPTFSGVEIRADRCCLIPNNPMRQDVKEYSPSRDPVEAMRLLEKYKLVVSPNQQKWSAWPFGRPLNPSSWDIPGFGEGETPCIAICRAVIAINGEKK